MTYWKKVLLSQINEINEILIKDFNILSLNWLSKILKSFTIIFDMIIREKILMPKNPMWAKIFTKILLKQLQNKTKLLISDSLYLAQQKCSALNLRCWTHKEFYFLKQFIMQFRSFQGEKNSNFNILYFSRLNAFICVNFN